MTLLELATIHAIHAAAIELSLADQRTVLLAQISPSVVATLPTVNDPSAQLFLDLNTLNGITLRDGSAPLRLWLEAALTLRRHRSETTIFEEALKILARPRETTLPLRHPFPSRAPPFSRIALAMTLVLGPLAAWLLWGYGPSLPDPKPTTPSATISSTISAPAEQPPFRCIVEASGLATERHKEASVQLVDMSAAANACWGSMHSFCLSYVRDSMLDGSMDIAKLKCVGRLKPLNGDPVSKEINWDEFLECSFVPVLKPGSLQVRWGTSFNTAEANQMVAKMKSQLSNSGSPQGARWVEVVTRGGGAAAIPLYFDGVDSDAICKWVRKCAGFRESCFATPFHR